MGEKKLTNLAKARLARGYTQEQLAHFLGISRQTYINIELGKRELTLSQASYIATVLRITIEDLLDTSDGSTAICDSVKAAEKYKQIIINAMHYGADSDRRITKTKLAKMVYLIDFIWYYEKSKPMSGVTYKKLPRGPVADIYFRILDELEEDGTALRESRGQAHMYSLVEHELSSDLLSDDELGLIKNVCKAWKDKSTDEIVRFTHEQFPWQVCFDGEAIPYSMIFQEEAEKIYGPVRV